MTDDDLALDYARLRYIELRGDGSKLPAKEWGGYDQDFDDAEHVHTHDEVEMLPMDHWGICGVADPPHGSFALLIFDVDIHKAPDDFDPDRVTVPQNTLITRSQNGGFHVYFIVSGCERGGLNESDFPMVKDPGFDVDIRGSAVSHHVVAPADIPGIGGDYRIVEDESITSVFEPAEAAERIRLDGEPLLEFSPDTRGGGYDFDVDVDPPEEMPTCYHAGLELRKAAPDDHPNTHKVNVLTAACGLAAGYDAEAVAGHFCGEWAPMDGDVDLSDREATEYQVQHIERGGYAPPAEQTLRDYGILDEGQHCDADCPINYHGPRDDDTPDLAVVGEQARDPAAEAAAVAGDGGVAADSGGNDIDVGRSFQEQVRNAIHEFNDDEIQAKTARHYIAQAFVTEFDFVYPEDEVRGWRSALYVYDEDEGIYEPRGEYFIEKELEFVAGDFVTNTVKNEIVGKVKRMSIERDDDVFRADPERLVVGNGILDLHTGELDDYSPHEYHRTKIDIDWSPDAGEPGAIDDFFHDIVEDRDVDTLYRLVAHTLYKEYLDEKAAMLIGSGQNGKSVFLDLIEEFLGGYNVAHRELQDFSEDDFALNNLEGKHANLATEIGEQELRDTTAFKKATGRDTIDAPVKYESPITFENHATLMFATNEMPVIGQDNHAIWRRWLYLEFPYEFSEKADTKEPTPKRVLMRRLTQDQELEGLLVRCQQEIQRWYEGEELFADAMGAEAVRDRMKKAAEPVYAFATECLENPNDDEAFEEKSVVRAAYQAFADEEELPRIPDNEFGARLLSLRDYSFEDGRKRDDGSRITVYKRCQLSDRGRQVLGLDEPGDGDDQETVEDDYEQAKPKVLNRLAEMVDENDGEPVSREALVWSVRDLGKNRTERLIDELETHGRIIEVGDGIAPNHG